MYFRFMAAILDFLHTQISDSVLTGLSVLPDPENMGKAIGISLLSCIRAELYVIFYLLPVNGRHILFLTYPFFLDQATRGDE